MPSIIKKMRIHKAVWWEQDGTDGYNRPKYKAPIEIACRWEGKFQKIVNVNAEEVMSSSTVYVDRAMKPDDVLLRGLLSAVTDLEEPLKNRGAGLIIGFSDLDTLKGKDTLFTAYL